MGPFWSRIGHRKFSARRGSLAEVPRLTSPRPLIVAVELADWNGARVDYSAGEVINESARSAASWSSPGITWA
jgi:hypothetical protein